jgi:hypothetical protein
MTTTTVLLGSSVVTTTTTRRGRGRWLVYRRSISISITAL